MTAPSFFEARQQSGRKIIDAHPVDAILFTGMENIRYLCGFTGSDGAFVLTAGGAFFLTDSRYWTQADEEVKNSGVVRYKKKLDGIVSLLSDLKLTRVGFESPALPFSFHRALTERLAGGAELVPLEEQLKELRAVKDAGELASMRKAIDISSRAFLHAFGLLREGSIESDIALEMECFMKRNGAEILGFDIIVASGKRSALPHGRASSKRIERGDFVLFDYGSRAEGYHSDETITVAFGSPSPEQEKVYQTVKEAHDKAIERVRPGVPIREIDAAARDYIRQRGYGDYFGHGLGHGVGLAVHEDPAVNADNRGLLQEGMVFTVEPGIYVPDWGGVRIEDMILVTSRGAEILTYLPKELRVIEA